MTVNDDSAGTNPAPRNLAAMLAALLGDGYSAAFAMDPAGRANCFVVDLTGPLGSQATGLGDTPAAALASAWPLGDLDDDGQDDDDVMDGPAIAAVARRVAGLREYITGVLAGAGEVVSHQYALEVTGGDLFVLAALLAADPSVVEDGPGDELEPYCRTCGHWIGHFLGLDGWQHYRGEPAAGGQRTLYDAGHEADPAWCIPPGRALAPADITVIRQALTDARWHQAQYGADDRAATYGALLGRMTGEAAGR